MTIDEFTDEIASRILDFFPERFKEAKVTTYSTVKNSRHVHGLCIRLKEQSVAPVFYMENYYKAEIDIVTDDFLCHLVSEMLPFYDDYFENGDISQIEQQIIDFKIDNYDVVKQYLRPIIVNRSYYSELLETFNYKTINDMAIILIIDIPQTMFKYGPCCIKVSKDIESLWKRDFDELYDDAINNLKSDDFILRDVSSRLFGKKEINLLNRSSVRNKKTLFELTSKDSTYGAGGLLCNSIMNKICELFPEGFYIIPSSIHECLIISKKTSESPNILKKQLTSINLESGLLTNDDILSFDIYSYSEQNNELVAV